MLPVHEHSHADCNLTNITMKFKTYKLAFFMELTPKTNTATPYHAASSPHCCNSERVRP